MTQPRPQELERPHDGVAEHEPDDEIAQQRVLARFFGRPEHGNAAADDDGDRQLNPAHEGAV